METYDLFDSDERFVRTGSKEDMRQLGLFTRSVHIFIFDEEGRLLICKRPSSKKVYPGVFTSSAGWHVESGETFEIAAYREMLEETGLETPLVECGRFDVVNEIERSIHYLYLAYPSAAQIAGLVFDTTEVETTEFHFPLNIVTRLSASPESFAPSFHAAMETYAKKRHFVLDFDHTLFDWYGCKPRLKEELEKTFGISWEDFETAKEKNEEELDGLYSIDGHLLLLAGLANVDYVELDNFFKGFLKDNYLYPDARELLSAIPKSDIVTILTYGHTENQLTFIRANIRENLYSQIICVDSKHAKIQWARRISHSTVGETVFVNDDPKEGANMVSVIREDSRYYMVERPNAKYTVIPENEGYAVVDSLERIRL